MYRVAIDGGALVPDSAKQFGNFTFAKELITALGNIDRTNAYTIYALNDVSIKLPANFEVKKITPARGFMSVRITLEGLMKNPDVFLALNQALPLFTRARVIAFNHGLSFLKFPELYPDSAGKMGSQIKKLMSRSEKIIVSSSRVKTHFNDIYGVEDKVIVQPFGIPTEFLTDNRKYKRKNFILFVGMNHKIKDIPFLISSFTELLKIPGYASYKFLLVGVDPSTISIPRNMSHKILPISHTKSISELHQYFAEAHCVVSASLYESFNLPIIEAASQNTPVVATPEAVIPELSEYVTISEKKPQIFAQHIAHSISQPKIVNVAQLKKEFDWDNYARRVIKLYES
ncbi:MAG: glycosyltransferase [Patescibacteria group bacterium]|jgi:glycosyltransferase involved in cell wall biosynthesis